MVNKSSPDDGRTADLSPQGRLALMAEQRQSATRNLRVDSVAILGAWGLEWLGGFGALYLASPKGPGPFLPTWAAGLILGVLFAVAVVVSVGQGMWHGRGVEGPSREIAAKYGWSWLLAFAALYAVNLGLVHRGLPSGVAPLLWSGSSLLVVGVMYLMGGILWKDNLQYGLGVWTLVVGAASVSAGVPGNFAVLSLAGGGGFLVAAALAYARARRERTGL